MSETETPAALLRRAAGLMREQAEAAKELTGDGNGKWFPWGTVQKTEWRQFPEPRPVPAAPYPFGDGGTEMADGQYVPTGEAFVEHASYAHDEEESWHEPKFFAGPMPEPVAAYIAGMHPGVALAVAEWLVVVARLIESDEGRVLGIGRVTGEAITVARAYLNEGGE